MLDRRDRHAPVPPRASYRQIERLCRAAGEDHPAAAGEQRCDLLARALDRDFDLQWFLVRKKVEGREAIQFERLVGQISAFVPSLCLEVPRSGEFGRFQPAKDPAELEKRRPDIERILRARGVL